MLKNDSALADENRDLDLIAKGWAHSSVGEAAAAFAAFEMAQSLRASDAYGLACVGISSVYLGLMEQAQDDYEGGMLRISNGLDELSNAVAMVSRGKDGEELGLPDASISQEPDVKEAIQAMTMSSSAYDPFFLRGGLYRAHFMKSG